MNNFYIEEEDIRVPINGRMAFQHRIKVMQLRSETRNHYKSLVGKNEEFQRIVHPGKTNERRALQADAFKQYPNRKGNPHIYPHHLKDDIAGPRGELYERVNRGSRPAGRMVNKQSGRQFNHKEPSPSNDEFNKPNSVKYKKRPEYVTKKPPDYSATENNQNHKESRKNRAINRRTKPYGLVYEKLFPDPGMYIRTPLGKYEEELISQLAHPELIRPKNCVDCHVQIYRIYQPIPVERLAAIELGDPMEAQSLRPLTEQKALALGVKAFPDGKPLQPDKNGSRWARPGQSFYRMSVVFDPTARNTSKEQSTPQEEAQESVQGAETDQNGVSNQEFYCHSEGTV